METKKRRPPPSMAATPSPLFTPIPEHDKLHDDDEAGQTYKHPPTPLPTSRKPSKSHIACCDEDDYSILCNKCRPQPTLSPSTLRSLFFSLTRRSPRPSEDWKLAATELSRKLHHTTRKRDEALLEATRLKHSLTQLELKLDRVQSHCHDLQTALDRQPAPTLHVDPFLHAVTDSRSATRHLTRALTAQLRLGAAGPRALDRIRALLQPYDVKLTGAQSLMFYMEALLNRVLYSEFEAEHAAEPLDPAVRCELNRAAFEAVRGIAWEDVLSKGTRHYSEGLSRFCDRRMSEVVGMLGWGQAWPECLLEAFFGAAKGAWVVHLLARTMHPAIPIMRVEHGARFEAGFMEDVGLKRVVQERVRMMVAPGFYLYSSGTCGLVKCRVVCFSGRNSSSNESDGIVNSTGSDGNSNDSRCDNGINLGRE